MIKNSRHNMKTTFYVTCETYRNNNCNICWSVQFFLISNVCYIALSKTKKEKIEGPDKGGNVKRGKRKNCIGYVKRL